MAEMDCKKALHVLCLLTLKADNAVPPLASAAVVAYRLTGSDKGVW
jgi:hypothetical protein